MKVSIVQHLQSLRASYWFIPSLMAIAALVLGAVMIWVDARLGSGWLQALGWYQQAKPEGAREVLSTVAGSMITVAGVVFSITIVAIAYAASQYGPRILTNFMADRGNQVTLGTFIATFVYSLIVLRTIHGGDSDFVPQIALIVGLALALCSIAVLIYFIHHVPQSIHVNTVVTAIGRQLVAAIGKQFPACFGESPPGSPKLPVPGDDMRNSAAAICARTEGYVQTVDDEALMRLACKHELVLWLERSPGDFVHSGRLVALAAPAARIDDDVADAIRDGYTLGGKRTPAQDLAFLIDELVEIAARALSPGVNDPYTAMTCLDWLGAAAAELAQREPPTAWRADPHGRPRVHAPPLTFDEQIGRGFGRMRPYLATDPNAAVHALKVLASTAECCVSDEQRAAVRAEAGRLVELARTELDGPSLKEVEAEASRSGFRDAAGHSPNG